MHLHYETHGAGEPVILIPGFASGAWNWFRQIDDLAKDFLVITFDPRGIGRSTVFNEKDLDELSMEVFANDVISVLNNLDIEKVSVIGASFGGFVAQNFALNFPARLNKLILACTSFGGAQHIAPDLDVLLAFAATDEMNTSERIRKFMVPAFTPEFVAENPEMVEKVCQFREKAVVHPKVYKAQLTAATTFDYSERVGEIKNETLILSGDKDKVVPVQNSVKLAEQMPNATLEIIKNGSHLFFVENADEFNRKVREFVLK